MIPGRRTLQEIIFAAFCLLACMLPAAPAGAEENLILFLPTADAVGYCLSLLPELKRLKSFNQTAWSKPNLHYIVTLLGTARMAAARLVTPRLYVGGYIYSL